MSPHRTEPHRDKRHSFQGHMALKGHTRPFSWLIFLWEYRRSVWFGADFLFAGKFGAVRCGFPSCEYLMMRSNAERGAV